MLDVRKLARLKAPKAPLQTVPVITEPFKKIAFDIVGPFPRTKDGYKYILLTICIASKYPEAILLKDVRAETVAEGMAEVFSRIGVPRQLLTDQGSQFVGKMVQQLCRKLNIEKLQTTPYHPQSNGCLERWHGTVVPMLKRCLEDKLDWSKQLKYALFACRCAPNRDSGFSPFEIIFGRHIRGPLELLKDVWETEEKRMMNVCDWIAELQDRLEVVRDVLRDKMKAAKEKQKVEYDRTTKLRKFEPGDMVLIRIPGLAAKLEDSWDGPYEVLKSFE